jgi:hypothetical protein
MTLSPPEARQSRELGSFPLTFDSERDAAERELHSAHDDRKTTTAPQSDGAGAQLEKDDFLCPSTIPPPAAPD